MGADVSTSDECTFNNTYHVQSVEDAYSVGVIFSDFERITTIVILPIILGVGLVGNGAFLYTIARVRSMWTATNFYLSNLAVADITFLTLAISLRLREYILYGVPNQAPLLGQTGCILELFTKYISHFAGLNIITFISLERYIAVCHPLRHRMITGRGRSVKLIIFCWLVALLLAPLVIPSSFEFVQYCLSWSPDDPDLQDRFPEIIGRCHSVEGKWANQLFHLTQTIPFFVAFFGNSFFYTRILLKLHQRDTFDRQRSIRTRNQVAVMLVVNGTVFFLTLTSFEITSILLFVEGFLDISLIPNDIQVTLFEVNRILVYFNSAVNPIVYTVTNARYRRAFLRAFRPTRCVKQPLRTSVVSNITTAQDIYQLSGPFSSVNLPAGYDSISDQTPGAYFNIALNRDDENDTNIENRTTDLSS